jgi:small-conductance mechanosensitive channel
MDLLLYLADRPVVLYVSLIIALGAYYLVRVILWLRQAESRRIRRLRRRKEIESIPTESPVDDALAEAQKRGVLSIERHATVIRRLVVPLLMITVVALATIPFLSHAPATAVTLLAAAVTVVLGIAARPMIENAMSGLVIAFSRLINIGDTITVDEQYGTVEDITITHTTIKLWDWRRYIVPNSRMIQASFLNYTVFDQNYWACIEFWISYEADLERVRETAVAIPPRSEHFTPHEPPAFWIMDLEPQGMRCWLAAWASSPANGWLLKHDIRTELVRELRLQGIATHMENLRIRDIERPPDGIAPTMSSTAQASSAGAD